MEGAPLSSSDAMPARARCVGDLVVGRYALERLVGNGGGGRVYRARDRLLGRWVAVKILTTGDDELAHRLASEGRLLAQLEHPNIVAVYDAGEDGDAAFLVMEYVAGGSLHDLLAKQAQLSPATVADIGSGVARALTAAHAAGICHRDVKPANILLPANGGSRLVDFGIARTLDQTAVTADGLVVGTPEYLSPEQCLGLGAGPPSDVYSLGLVLLECLTGRRPFPGTLTESMGARLSTDPAIPAGLSRSWVSILEEATRRQPSDRLTAAELAARLGPVTTRGMRGEPAVPTPITAATHDALTQPMRAAAWSSDPATRLSATRPSATRPLANTGAHHHGGRRTKIAVAMLIAALALGLTVAGLADRSAPRTSPTSTTSTSLTSITVTTATASAPTTPVVSSPTTAAAPQPKARAHGEHAKKPGPAAG